MKILGAVLGFILGILIGVIVLAAISTSASDQSMMNNTFVIANIFGIVGAIFGYRMAGKAKNKK